MTLSWSKLLLLVACLLFAIGAVLALTGGALGPVGPQVAALLGLACFAGAGIA